MAAMVVLSGCGSSAASGGNGGSAAAEQNGPETEVMAVVDGFFGVLQSGDFSNLSEYCTQEVLDEQDLQAIADVSDFDNEIYESLGLEDMGLTIDDLSDDTKNALTSFSSTIMTSLIEGYNIDNVSVNRGGDSAEVTGTVTYGYDTSFDFDMDAINNEVMGDFEDEKLDEYAQIYTDNGEAAMYAAIMNDMMPELLNRYSAALLETQGGTDEIQMTLEQTDGKWMITEMLVADDSAAE